MHPLKIIANTVTDGVDDAISNAGLGDRTDIINPVQVLVSVALGLIGLLAVVMVIIGAVQLSTSQGDSGKVKKARDTIMYGIIGIVVAILAFAIVNFVMSSIL
jgi:uncharacterized membrane protein